MMRDDYKFTNVGLATGRGKAKTTMNRELLLRSVYWFCCLTRFGIFLPGVYLPSIRPDQRIIKHHFSILSPDHRMDVSI